MQGEYTEFDRVSRLFSWNVNLHVSKQYAAHSHMIVKPFPLLGDSGHAPPRKLKKNVAIWYLLVNTFFFK